MARLVFGMNQSLDGYIDHTAFAPGQTVFRHFVEQAAGQAGNRRSVSDASSRPSRASPPRTSAHSRMRSTTSHRPIQTVTAAPTDLAGEGFERRGASWSHGARGPGTARPGTGW